MSAGAAALTSDLVSACESGHTRTVAAFRAVSHVEVDGRRLRFSATVTVTVSIEDGPPAEVAAPRRRPTSHGWIPEGLRDPGVRWDVLPERIRPEDWTVAQAVDDVPATIMIGERERRPEGFGPGG